MEKRFFIVAAIVLLVFGACKPEEPGDRPVRVSWSGMWENDVDLFGTFELDVTFTGEYMSYSSGSGTASGTIIVRDFAAAVISSSPVNGTWENNLEQGHDEFEYTLYSDDGIIEMHDVIGYATVVEISDDEYTIGAMYVNAEPGDFQVLPVSVQPAIPDVTSAALLTRDIPCLDLAFIDDVLYAIAQDGTESSLVTIDPDTGTVSADISIPDCASPAAIAGDGSYVWIVDNPDVGNSSLYRYSGTNFTAVDGGYPVENADLNGLDALSVLGPELHGMFGSLLYGVIGQIGLSDGTVTPILGGGVFDGIPRADSLESVSDGFWTVYFAAGGEWCRIQKNDTAGDLVNYDFSPSNDAGPIAIDGTTLYILLPYPARIFTIQL